MTHKTGPSYTEDNANESSLTFVCLSSRKSSEVNKKFHGAFQSNNAVFAGFNHVKCLCSEDWGFYLFCFANHR